jgi:hypothetical protein
MPFQRTRVQFFHRKSKQTHDSSKHARVQTPQPLKMCTFFAKEPGSIEEPNPKCLILQPPNRYVVVHPPRAALVSKYFSYLEFSLSLSLQCPERECARARE